MRLTVTNTLPLLAMLVSLAQGQTEVDLRTQSKSVDFSAAPSTKPFSAGPALPATCTVGQMYFVTSAISGQNVYGCSGINSWTLQSGGPTSPTTVDSAGTPVGTRGTLDLSAGPGLLWSISDTGTKISAQNLLDTTLAQTRSNDQSGATLFCVASSTASPGLTYSCSMNPSLSTYTTGMLLRFMPDVSIVGGEGSTLNVDALGPVAIEKSDGATNPASTDIVGGSLYELWYDGHVFRLVAGNGATGPAGPAGPAGGVALVANGTAVLGTSPILPGTCAPAVTSTATGVTTSDDIQADFNADPTSTPGYAPSSGGVLSIVRFPTANAVSFKVCNNTTASVTPGAITLNWRVVR